MVGRKAGECKRRELSLEERQEVVEASWRDDCKLSDLLQRYGISRSTLYVWRKHCAARDADAPVIPDAAAAPPTAFVEVRVAPPPRRVLSKASLQYDDFTLSLEGTVCSAQLVSILSLLEASC